MPEDEDQSRPRRSPSGTRVALPRDASKLAAVLCIERRYQAVGQLLRARLGGASRVELVHDVLDLNEVARSVLAATLIAVDPAADTEVARALEIADRTWPCAPRMCFGRPTPSVVPSTSPHLVGVDVWESLHRVELSQLADDLTPWLERAAATRIGQLAAGRAFAKRYRLRERATKLVVLIALRLPEHTLAEHLGIQDSSQMRRFMRRSVYSKLPVRSRADLVTRVLDFEREWLAAASVPTPFWSRAWRPAKDAGSMTQQVPSLAAILCVGRSDGGLVDLVRARLGGASRLVVVRDLPALEEAMRTVTTATVVAVGAGADLKPAEALDLAGRAWPCAPRIFFGRHAAPTLPPTAAPELEGVDLWTTPYFDDVRRLADALVTCFEQGVAVRLAQIAAGRAFAAQYRLGPLAAKLVTLIALRLPESTWGDHLGKDSSRKMRRFLHSSVYAKVPVRCRPDLVTRVLDFEREWLASATDLELYRGMQVRARGA